MIWIWLYSRRHGSLLRITTLHSTPKYNIKNILCILLIKKMVYDRHIIYLRFYNVIQFFKQNKSYNKEYYVPMNISVFREKWTTKQNKHVIQFKPSGLHDICAFLLSSIVKFISIKIISSPNTKKLYLFHSPNIMQSHKFIWQGILTFHEMYNLFIILVYTIIVNSEYFINQLIYETTLHLYILST